MEDILIKNGMVMDGTGNPAVRADVLIHGDRILDVGILSEAGNSNVIDAEGLAVAPGFIDAHTHLDFFLPSPRHAEVLKTWAFQGVTTIVAGNCGWSPAPIDHTMEEDVSTYWNFAHPRDGLEYEWTTMREYLDFLERNGQALNVAILTGFNILRTNAMGGFFAQLANPKEIAEMKRMLKESLEAGSIGLSLGLFYCPGIFSNTDELMKLASAMKEFGAPLVPHTRGLTVTYDKAVEEVIQIAESNKLPLQISHHAGGTMGDMTIRDRALKAIKEAMDRGVEIGHDNIPWACGPTTVLALLPPWLFDGGVKKGLDRLRNPDIRRQTVHELKTHVPTWPTWENRWWTDKFLGFSSLYAGFRKEGNTRFENMSMQDIAQELNQDPYDALFDLLIEEEGRLFMIGGLFDDPMGDDFIAFLLTDPNCSIISDIVGADFKHGNPAACGAFTKVLGYFARDRGVMTQEEAVRRMTSLPAKQMGLKDRGIIKKGAFADIAIFDPNTVNNRASFKDPYQLSEGVEYLFINGKLILDKGNYRTDALAGQVIRGNW
ncbi:MAG: amidohydrolase family protein [Desulfobacteraceae bacterium]|nr:amidohydrolase family protein [Desulfobacteraceae bacterium]